MGTQQLEKSLLLFVGKDMGGTVPTEVQVIPFGLTNTKKGSFLHDEQSQAAVLAEFANRANDIVIDYEHQTLTGGEAPAAGWIKKLINKGKEGTWAVVEWTERAQNYIASREYRYLSPVFLVRKSDRRVVLLQNAALTNDPNIDGMVPLVNKASSINQRKENDDMKWLIKLLGLPEDATEAQIKTAAEQVVNKARAADDATVQVANKAVLEALGIEGLPSESEILGTIAAMKQGQEQAGTLATKVAELETKINKRDAADLVAQAIQAGKITPAQKDWAEKYAETDPEGFKVFVSKASVVVQTGNLAGGAKPGDGGSIDEIQQLVNKQMGIDEETFKKFNPTKED